MKILVRFLWCTVCLSFLLVAGCKKENKSQTDEEEKITFTLNKNEYYQYQTLVAEANNNDISAFDNKVYINGIEHPAILVENKYIAAIITPDITPGAAKISFTVNSSKQSFDVNILQLNDVTNPDISVNDYVNQLKLIYSETIRAMDSINYRLGKKPDEFYTSLKSDIKILDDSIAYTINKFNQLNADEKRITANFLEANKLDLQENLQVIQDINQLIIQNKLRGRRNLICESDLMNTSEKLECILRTIRRNIRSMILKNIANTTVASAAGYAVGSLVGTATLNPAAGWAAGSMTGLLLLGYLNTKSISYYLSVLSMNHESTYEVVGNEIETWRLAPSLFYNDEDFALKFNVQRRNFNESDLNSKYIFISEYLAEGNNLIAFVQKYFRDKFSKMPTFKPAIKSNHKLEDLKYISVSVKDNPNVKVESLSGTTEKPLIKFTSDAIEDQNFTYTVNYDDGVFQTREEYPAVLKTRIGITLNDTTLGGNSSVIKFKVHCPENMSWEFSYPTSWMIVLPNSGQGKNENCELAIQQNYTGAKRSGSVTFKAGNYSKSVTITQNAYNKIIYASFEKTLSSVYQEGNRSQNIVDLKSFKYTYTPGSGEPNLNFQLDFQSSSSFNKYAAPYYPFKDSIREGYVQLEIKSTDGSKIFPYIDINSKSLNNNNCGFITGYNTFIYSYFNNINETIDSRLFRNTDSTLHANYTVSIAEKIVQFKKWTKGTWCDLAPYPAPRHLPYGQNNLYLPFRIQNGSNFHYGWIRISTINESSFVIHDLAFQATPNIAIKTGEK